MIFYKFRLKSGGLVDTGVNEYWSPTLSVKDPEIPYLPLEDAAGGGITGTGSTSQAQTADGSGTYTPAAITAVGATSQAQTASGSGTYTPAAITATGATSQAQTADGSGTVAAPGVTGTGATSQAQTSAGSGTYTPAAVTGTGTTSQAQTTAGTGTFTGAGITGTGATSQAQTSSGIGEVTSPNILTGGGEYLRHKLIRQFEDDQRRVEALSKLPAIKPAERLAVKRAAHKLATSVEPFTFDDVADEINASLRETDTKGQESHLDWVLYFLRVEAYNLEKQAQEAEELEIIAAMMMARKQWQL